MAKVTAPVSTRKIITRMGDPLKKRLDRYKYTTSLKEERRVTSDEIVCAAVDNHLKKFGF